MSSSIRILTVADLHQSKRLYSELIRAVCEHKPNVVALVGDFLDMPGTGSDLLSVRACGEIITGLVVDEIVVTRGNHEDWNYLALAEVFTSSSRPIRTLHGETHTHGPLAVVGFPCLLGDETAFTLHKAPLPPHPDGWLPKLVRKNVRASRTLWLMHEPPKGTPLTPTTGPISGNPEWTDAIHRFSPWLVICGHDHRTPVKSGKWHCRLGDTVVVNVGQPHDGGLHYALIEAEFDSSRPSLPRRMVVDAYPWGQSVELPLR